MKPIKEYFIENLEAALSSIGVEDLQAEQYILVPTADDEKYTTMDEIYKLWYTPTFTGIRMSYDSVINSLVKEKKKVSPLWIKVHYVKGKPIVLQFSQRFRKIRDIKLRRRDNPHPPFEIEEDPLFEFSESKERSEAIRILFFTRKMSDHIKDIIGEEITYNDVIDSFNTHFEEHRFFPASYTQIKEGDDAYSSLVIVKDIRTDTYSVFKNPKIEVKIKSNWGLEQVVRYYVKEELGDKICGVEVRE